jgi:hypothetical protein
MIFFSFPMLLFSALKRRAKMAAPAEYPIRNSLPVSTTRPAPSISLHVQAGALQQWGVGRAWGFLCLGTPGRSGEGRLARDFSLLSVQLTELLNSTPNPRSNRGGLLDGPDMSFFCCGEARAAT